MHFLAVKLESRKKNVLVLCFFHISKTVHLQKLKGMKSSNLGMRKGYYLSMEGIQKGIHSVKNGM